MGQGSLILGLGRARFTSNIDVWKPAFEEFLKSLGFS